MSEARFENWINSLDSIDAIEWKALRYIISRGKTGAINSEIRRHYGIPDDQRNTWSPASSNLKDRGMIFKKGVRRAHTGNNEDIWFWTGRHDPMPLPIKKDQLRQENKELKKRVEKLEAIIKKHLPEQASLFKEDDHGEVS